MSPLSRRSGEEEEPATAALNLDLEERVCALCRRDLPAWAEQCSECGGKAVRRVDLPPEDDPLLARLLSEDDIEGGPEA
ncbi:MAG: hypothetical protein M3O70_21055 [Actinomycetota bacterium]|nr:hypothetical protein [Actinomycetota bacterium]